jgi:hypothetical protein
MNLIRKQLNIEITDSDEAEGTIRAVISSGQPDRHGEIIDQTSWDLTDYLKNPVVLWAHDHSQPAIGQAIEIGINSDGMLEAVIKFAVKEYAFARTIFNLYAGKFIRAFSVGFLSGESEEKDGITILKNNVLYEFSAVNVGADALALAKSKGIDISVLELSRQLDNSGIDEKRSTDVTKEGRVLSSKNREIIEKAKNTLEDVLRADKKKIKKFDKRKHRKILNKAVRELLKAKQV